MNGILDADDQTLSQGVLLLARKVKVGGRTKNGNPTTIRGALSADASDDASRLVLKVLCDSSNRSNHDDRAGPCEVFEQSFDAQGAARCFQGGTVAVPEADAMPKLAELLSSAIDNKDGELKANLQIADDGSSIEIRVVEKSDRCGATLGKHHFTATLPRSSDPSTSVLTFIGSLIETNAKLEEDAMVREKEKGSLESDRDDCRKKLRQLSDFSNKEKTRLIQSFFELYKDLKDEQATADRDGRPLRMMGAATASVPLRQGDRKHPPAASAAARRTGRVTERASASSQGGQRPNTLESGTVRQAQGGRRPKSRRTEVDSKDLDMESEEDSGDKDNERTRARRPTAVKRYADSEASGDDTSDGPVPTKKPKAVSSKAGARDSTSSTGTSSSEARAKGGGARHGGSDTDETDPRQQAESRTRPKPPRPGPDSGSEADDQKPPAKVAAAYDSGSETDYSL